MYALEIKGLTKHYKDSNFKLNEINLVVPKGSIVGLVGKNGAGKSSIINSVFDIVNKDSGEILFYGQQLTDKNKKLKNEIGVVFDTLSYSGEMTVKKLEKVLKDLYEAFDSAMFHQYIECFELPKDKKFKTFSRGMTMKLSIAVAISHGAKLLILDEATAGLDPVMREGILDIFLEFVSDETRAVMLSSHISSDLEKVADYIAVIDEGKVILTEEKDNLLYKYAIAKMKEKDFEKLSKEEYIAYRKRGLQIEVLVADKTVFSRSYPQVVIDQATIDEILPLITKEAI